MKSVYLVIALLAAVLVMAAAAPAAEPQSRQFGQLLNKAIVFKAGIFIGKTFFGGQGRNNG